MLTKTAMRSVGVALLALASALVASVEAAGVCYSPFHAEKYFSKPAEIEQVLLADMQQIARATDFSAVRTYHAQFYGQNVIDAVVANKLQVAIGIQMVGVNGASYSYLEDDIQAAISAATNYPESVLAIYAGNENLKNGDFGSSSADEIIAVINKVKSALKGTKGANVPVGTVQRLEEWLHATDADRVAAASDVVGVNIYPFFTKGGEADMIGALDAQWTQIVSKVGSSKARLTETGWPSQGSRSDAGNYPTLANAEKYFAAFSQWAAAKHAVTSPFYFMMYDLLSAHATDYEQHFGVAIASGELKFNLGSSSAASTGSAGQSNGSTGASTGPSAGSTGASNGGSPSASAGSSGPSTSQSAGSPPAAAGAASSDEVAGEADRSADSLPASSSSSTTSFATSTSSSSATTVTPSPSPTVVVSSAIGSATNSGVNSVSSTTNVISSVMTTPSAFASSQGVDDSASSAGSSNSGSSASKAPETPETEPLPSLDDAGVVSSSSLSGSGFGDQGDVGFGSSSFSGSIGSSSSSSSEPVNNDPDVGDVDSNAPVTAPDLTPQTFAPVPSTSSSSSSASKAKELETQEAQAKQARDVSGGQGTAFTGLTAGVGLAGVAVIAVIAVYVQKRRNESENQISITTADARDSTPSVYSDPLGTRFSSIVMITPNGDGVCIL